MFITEPQDVLMSDPESSDIKVKFQNLYSFLCTSNSSNKLHNVDDSFDTVTGGIDHDDENEDAGNKDIPSLSLAGVRKQEGFLLYSSVDEDIKDNKEHEGDETEEN